VNVNVNYIQITTSDNIAIEYRLAGAGSRLSAAVIDLLVQTAAQAAVYLLLNYLGPGRSSGIFGLFLWNGPITAILIVSFFLIYFGYFIFFEMAMNGQSPGKRLFRLRVIGSNGRPVGIFPSVIRSIFRNTVDMMGVGVVAMLCSRKSKRIGDMVASTLVISENERQVKQESLAPWGIAPVNTVIDSAGLTADEIYFLEEFYARRAFLPDRGEKIKRMLGEYFASRMGVTVEEAIETYIYSSKERLQ